MNSSLFTLISITSILVCDRCHGLVEPYQLLQSIFFSQAVKYFIVWHGCVKGICKVNMWASVIIWKLTYKFNYVCKFYFIMDLIHSHFAGNTKTISQMNLESKWEHEACSKGLHPPNVGWGMFQAVKFGKTRPSVNGNGWLMLIFTWLNQGLANQVRWCLDESLSITNIYGYMPPWEISPACSLLLTRVYDM
mgnify:CR=1 FL=1